MANLFRSSERQSDYCVVCSNNNMINPEYSYFRFPKDEERCKVWKNVLNIERLNSYTPEQSYKRFRVCSAHFEDRMFSSIQKNRLKRDAVPILDRTKQTVEVEKAPCGIRMQTMTGYSVPSTSFAEHTSKERIPSASEHSIPSSFVDPHFEEIECVPTTSFAETYSEDVGTQTSTRLSRNSPREIHLRNKIRVLQANLRKRKIPSKHQVSRREVVEYVKKNCSPVLATILETELEHFGKHPKGSRYSDDYKQFASTIYLLGPKVYEFLAKYFHLPSKSTLFRNEECTRK